MKNKDLYIKAMNTVVDSEPFQVEEKRVKKNNKIRTKTYRIAGIAFALVFLGIGMPILAKNAGVNLQEFFEEKIMGRSLDSQEKSFVEHLKIPLKDNKGDKIIAKDDQAIAEPLEVICDGTMLYIRMKITASKDVEFDGDKGTYTLQDENGNDFFPDYSGSFTGGNLEDGVTVISNKEIEIVQLYKLERKDEIDEPNFQDCITLPEKYAFHGVWLKDKDDSYEQVLNGEFSFPMQLHPDFAMISTKELGQVEISQFAVYTEKEIGNTDVAYKDIYVSMADGTEVHNDGTSLNWEHLIDIGNIKSLHIGNQEYAFESVE